MSLDVYLVSNTVRPIEPSGVIFIRENGRTMGITREEWDERFPGREPVAVMRQIDETSELYSRNITHNLNKMAMAAEIYQALWRPEEEGFTKAKDLIVPLEKGLAKLKAEPDHFKEFNPSNGWGNYEGLVAFVSEYLEKCKEYPEADVKVSR